MIYKIIFYLILIILFTIIILKNNQFVDVDLIFYKTKMSLIVIIILSVLFGVIISSIAWLKMLFKKNRTIFELKQKTNFSKTDEKSTK